jgi:hypothetical protein
MIEKAIKILEFIVNIFTNIKNIYRGFRKKSENKKIQKDTAAVKKEVADGDIDDINKRLMR